jgi:hypothetical protein
MAAVSATVWVEHESQMDTVTALSGSGPAYFFLFMEALEAAAHERGLPNDIAHKLTLETAFGAAQMARQSGGPLALLREQAPLKEVLRQQRSKCSMRRASMLSSHMRWRRRTAARPNSRPSSVRRRPHW